MSSPRRSPCSAFLPMTLEITMKRWLLLCVGAAALLGGDAHADRYLLRVRLDLRLTPQTVPHELTIECYLGERDLSRVKPGNLGKRELFGGHWWDRVRGITWKQVKLDRSVGIIDVDVPYECAGGCQRRYYACRVAGAQFFVDPAKSVVMLTGAIGSGAIAERTACEGRLSYTEVNGTGSPCRRDCECNNVKFRGECRAGRCAAVARESCEHPGTVRSCVDPLRRCSGRQVCAPPYLSDRVKNWSDCECG